MEHDAKSGSSFDFCCDEKTQCQALERTQPSLPLGVGHVRTKTHDYCRHGTTTLFAVLDYLTGRVVHDHHRRHTHAEWLSFLKKVRRSAPEGVTVEIVADNYATHRHLPSARNDGASGDT